MKNLSKIAPAAALRDDQDDIEDMPFIMKKKKKQTPQAMRQSKENALIPVSASRDEDRQIVQGSSKMVPGSY